MKPAIPSEVADDVALSQLRLFRRFAHALPSGAVMEGDESTAGLFTGLASAPRNGVFCASECIDPVLVASLAERCAVEAQRRGDAPWSISGRQDRITPAIAGIAERFGLTGRVSFPVMFATLQSFDRHALAGRGRLRRVRLNDRDDYLRVLTHSFAAPAAMLEPYASPEYLGLVGSTHYFIDRDGRPAGIGSVIAEGEWSHLLNIAVLPDLRRRGLGRELMAGLLATIAEQGKSLACLQATRDSRPLYEAFGFSVCDLHTSLVHHGRLADLPASG